MIKYDALGYNSLNEYLEAFFESLLPTNKSFEYFVDWDRVLQNFNRFRSYLEDLDEVCGARNLNEARERLRSVLGERPEVVEVIPSLIAERTRDGVIRVVDYEGSLRVFNFRRRSLQPHEIEEIVDFCDRTGLLRNLLKVRDLGSYLLGVEVGLDTNARKGRSGRIFESMVLRALRRYLPKSIRIHEQDPSFSLYEVLGKRGRGKRHDFVLYISGKPRYIIEANFFNVTGSKPISIAESYISLAEKASEMGKIFVWITDGPAWRGMREPIERAMKEIDFIVNFRMIPRLAEYIAREMEVGV